MKALQHQHWQQTTDWFAKTFARSSFGPFGPEVAKKSPKRGKPGTSRPPGVKKNPRRSRKKFKIVEKYLMGTHLGLFLPLWARRAQMTPEAGPENPKDWPRKCCLFSATLASTGVVTRPGRMGPSPDRHFSNEKGLPCTTKGPLVGKGGEAIL